jgi:hypothetical protein
MVRSYICHEYSQGLCNIPFQKFTKANFAISAWPSLFSTTIRIVKPTQQPSESRQAAFPQTHRALIDGTFPQLLACI